MAGQIVFVQFPYDLFVGVQLDDLVAVAAGDEQMTVRERHDFMDVTGCFDLA